MSDYDDDEQDEGGQIDLGTPVLKIRAEGEVTLEYIVRKATENALRIVHAKILPLVEEKISEAVDAAIAVDALRTRIEAAVESVLSDGFEQFDEYGRKKGTKTIKERVAEELARQHKYYNRDCFQQIVHEKFGAELDKELRPHVARAKEQFSAQVDGVLNAKLADALRGALGLGKS